MADPAPQDTDKFVELDGVKYKEDPVNPGQALLGDDDNLVPYEEKKKEEEPEAPENETEEEKKVREKAEEEETPPRRKSAKDHIIERKQKKIDKLEKKEEEPETPPEGGEEVTSEGKKAIQKEVEKITGPLVQSVRTNLDDQELANVLAKYPESKSMEKQIRKYMTDDAYKDVSIEFIYLGLAAKKLNLQKKRDKADEEAEGDKTGGHPKRDKEPGKIPDVRKYSDQQIGDLVHKVMTGQT